MGHPEGYLVLMLSTVGSLIQTTEGTTLTSGMKPLSAEEEWARSVVEQALLVPVVQHDDGSRDGMFDLSIAYPEREAAAVEVIAAADRYDIQLWKEFNGRDTQRWCDPGIAGGWVVFVAPKTSAKRLRAELPALLGQLEGLDVRWYPSPLLHDHFELDEAVGALGVVSAHRSGTHHPGSIYVSISIPSERAGGMVPANDDPLATWLGDFLRGSNRTDVLQKLQRSGAAERHAFVLLPGFTTAPFPVADLLMVDAPPLPITPPALPEQITDVWAMSTWSSGSCFHWSSSTGWRSFHKNTGSVRPGAPNPDASRKLL